MSLRAWWSALPGWKQSLFAAVALLPIFFPIALVVAVTSGHSWWWSLLLLGGFYGVMIGSLIRWFVERKRPSPRNG
jgi:hypothetical protein